MNSRKLCMENLYQFDEEFRDTISTVDEQGKRVWVYPKKPKGKFHNYRIVVSVILLALLFSGPFIKLNGQPFMLVNVFERKFIFFGIPFWPQDFHILALMLIAFVVFIVLFTVVFGRVWCGWACPQTIFMEMVFRKIEYWIEGGPIQQKRLNQEPWTGRKIFKKSLKQFIFILISLLISHTVMAYLIGIEQVGEIISQPPSEHIAGFIGLMSFTGIFYFVFSWFREQACIAVCPYGRLQGVFLGDDSISVMYDWLRGEPRGKLKKGNQFAENQGDCIDCKMCVHVCPTGIDIRNGTQLECVNCTACIDACDDIMTKVNKPTGLIRYASINSVKEKTKKLMTPRVWGYSAILAILVSAIAILLVTRTDVETTLLRVPGQLYQLRENDRISNIYKAQFINKTYNDVTIELRVAGIPDASVQQVGNVVEVIPSSSKVETNYFVELPREALDGPKTRITVEIYINGKLAEVEKTNFAGPF